MTTDAESRHVDVKPDRTKMPRTIDREQRYRPVLTGSVVILHLGVAAVAYRAQDRFYTRLGAPTNLGYSLVAIVFQPATIAITAAITAIVATAYFGSRLIKLSWVVLSLVAFLASVTVTMATVGTDADHKAARVEAGHPVCSGAFAPARLCAQTVTVTGVSGLDLPWLPGGQALYLGDQGHSYALLDPISHKTHIVSQDDVSLVQDLTPAGPPR